MVKISKALILVHSLVVGNLLLLALYMQNFSTIKISLASKEDATTEAYRVNVTTTTTSTPLEECVDTEYGPIQGPVRPNPNRAAEMYWIQSQLRRPLANHQNVLGHSVEVSYTGMKKRTDILKHNDECSLNHTVAIIIPFRNREHHLQILLGHLIPILRRQRLRFTVFVVEQFGKLTFNKGRLMNTGFEFAAKFGRDTGNPYDCFIFQDVDLLVEHDTLPYRCSDSANEVHHLSTAIDKFKYKVLCCGITVGGAVAFREDQFRKVNGYPNSLWGWGGEDDDMNGRIKMKRLKIVRPEAVLGRFTMIHHKPDRLNPMNRNRYSQLRNIGSRLSKDGLSNLDTDIRKVEIYPLFVRITVKVGIPPQTRSSIIIRIRRHTAPETTTPTSWFKRK